MKNDNSKCCSFLKLYNFSYFLLNLTTQSPLENIRFSRILWESSGSFAVKKISEEPFKKINDKVTNFF